MSTKHTSGTVLKTASADRRTLLAAMIWGGSAVVALPKRWTRPVVDSVLLPAHAQMSGDEAESEETGPNITIDCSLSAEVLFNGGFIRLTMTGTVTGPGTTGADLLEVEWSIESPENTSLSVNVDVEPDGSFDTFINFPNGGQTLAQATVSFQDTDTFGGVSCFDEATVLDG